MDYCVVIRTGDKQKAGTNAKVYITLIGTQCRTPEIRLDHPNYNDFERNHRDEFNIGTNDVGELTQIRIRHDNTGKGPGWYLDSILVIRGSDGGAWETHPKRWLATTVPGDGGIDQTFSVVAANASFDYVSLVAKMKDVDTGERKAFYIDPRSRSIRITLNNGATSALVQNGASYWYFSAGNQTLPVGGEYVLAVGTYAIFGTNQPLPEVCLAYNRLKA